VRPRAAACIMTVVRRLLAFLAAVTLAAAQDDVPTFRTGARLVELSVTVTGRDGQPVTSLTRDDFTLTDRRQKRDIAFFRYEGAPQPPAPRTLEPGHFSNRTELLGEQPRNIIALVLDSLNTRPEDKAQVRIQLLRYLREITPGTRVAVYHIGSSLRVLHDFTADATSLRAAVERSLLGLPLQAETNIREAAAEADQILESLAGDPGAQDIMRLILQAQIEAEQFANAAAQRNRTFRTLESLEALGRHLSGIPGRKSLVWISGGISMAAITGAMGRGPGGKVDSFEARITETGRQLAQQNVALYIVEAGGLALDPAFTVDTTTFAPDGRRRSFEDHAEAARVSADPRSALQTLASVTGGRFLFNTNDMLQGFKHARNDQLGSYTLAFYAPDAAGDRWHDLRVQVKHPGARVLHRQGYRPAAPAPPEDAASWNEDQWHSAIRNPLASSQIRLSARAARNAEGALRLALSIHTPDLLLIDGEGAFELCIADLAADSILPFFQNARLRLSPEQLERARAQGVSYQREWTPSKDTTRIRVVVRDRSTGLYGALDLPLDEIPAPEMM
jgi:VWFA-related protein